MKEIAITEIENLSIGQVEDKEAGTGCTVFVSEKGMTAGMDVRGEVHLDWIRPVE